MYTPAKEDKWIGTEHNGYRESKDADARNARIEKLFVQLPKKHRDRNIDERVRGELGWWDDKWD